MMIGGNPERRSEVKTGMLSREAEGVAEAMNTPTIRGLRAKIQPHRIGRNKRRYPSPHSSPDH